MNRKGFTLAELLVAISIIAILSIIIVPTALKSLGKNNARLCKTLRDNIVGATKVYVNNNRNSLDFSCGEEKEIPLSTLFDSGSLTGSTINPYNEEDLSNTSVIVIYDCDTKNFNYKYDIECE